MDDKEQKIIIEVDIENDKAVAAIEELKKKAIEQKAALDKMTNGLENNEKATKQATQEYIKAQAEYKNTQEDIRKTEKQLQLLTRAENDEVVSIDALRRTNALLTKQRNALNLETDEGVKELKRLNETIDANNQKIKENIDIQGQQKMTIGDYKNQVKKALAETDLFGGAIAQVTDVFKGLQKGFDIAIKGANTFKVALAATGIGLLIAAVGLLINFFKKTETGAKILKQALAGIGAVVNNLVGVLSSLGSGLFSILKGDFKKGINEIGGAFNNLAGNVTKTVKAAMELEKLKDNLDGLARVTSRLVAELEGIADKQNAIADDATRSFNERAAAAKLATEAAKQAAKKEIELANESYKVKEKELDNLKASNGDYQTQIELSNELDALDIQRLQAKNKLEMIIYNSEKKQRELKQDKFEQELDYILDIYDINKTNLEKQLDDDTKTASEKLKILNDIKEADKRNQVEITELYAKQTGKKIDLQKLLSITNVKELNNEVQNKLNLTEKEGTRLLEVINERRNYTQDLYELERDLNKAKVTENVEAAKKSIELLESEVKQHNEASKEKLKNAQLTNKELFDAEIKRLKDFLDANTKALQTKAAADVENAATYNTQIINITNETNNTILELTKEFNEQQKELELQRVETDYNNKKEILQNNELALIELERQSLKKKKAQEIEFAKKTGADIALINEKYRLADIELTRAATEAKLNVALQFADSISQIASENTVVAKAAAVAQTVINTYLGAQSAFAQTPGGIVIKSIAASLAVATGLMNVKKILSVSTNTKSASSSGGGSGGSASVAPSVGQGIISRETSTATQTSEVKASRTTLVVDNVTYKQEQKSNEAATAVL